MEIIIEDFERAGFYCDLEINAEWDRDDCYWTFSVISWRNRVCNPRTGENKNPPVWKKPAGKLAVKLAKHFESWFDAQSRQRQEELTE